MTFTFQKSKTKSIKSGHLFIFRDIAHFLINSLKNMLKNLRENDF